MLLHKEIKRKGGSVHIWEQEEYSRHASEWGKWAYCEESHGKEKMRAKKLRVSLTQVHALVWNSFLRYVRGKTWAQTLRMRSPILWWPAQELERPVRGHPEIGLQGEPSIPCRDKDKSVLLVPVKSPLKPKIVKHAIDNFYKVVLEAKQKAGALPCTLCPDSWQQDHCHRAAFAFQSPLWLWLTWQPIMGLLISPSFWNFVGRGRSSCMRRPDFFFFLQENNCKSMWYESLPSFFGRVSLVKQHKKVCDKPQD